MTPSPDDRKDLDVDDDDDDDDRTSSLPRLCFAAAFEIDEGVEDSVWRDRSRKSLRVEAPNCGEIDFHDSRSLDNADCDASTEYRIKDNDNRFA